MVHSPSQRAAWWVLPERPLPWFVLPLLASFALSEGLGAPVLFRRGDSNGDGRVNISDAIQTLGFLFLGSPETLDCSDAADTNDNSKIDLSDAVYELNFLFLGGSPPAPPFPGCGPDTTADPLNCLRYGDCGLLVTIDSPLNLAVTSADAVDVSGSVSGAAKWVTVNGISGKISEGRYVALAVPLVEGANRISAKAYNDGEELSTASIQVVRDTTPPRVVITSPADFAVVVSPHVTVTGAVNDTITGAVNEAPPRCQVNGYDVAVRNGAFTAEGVPLASGLNDITVKVTDSAGNTGKAAIQITFEDSPVKRIDVASGQIQSAPIGQALPELLVARLLDEASKPVAKKPVVFRVTQSNGRFADGSRLVSMLSDQDGKAVVGFTTGTRSGAGCNRVEATALGFSGKASFFSTSLAGAPAKIAASSRTPQRSAVNTVLPEPLVALVTDAGGNGIPDLPVQLKAVKGGGYFEPSGLNSVELRTDVTGRIATSFVLGPAGGVENNLVEASFEGMNGFPASFAASGLVPGRPADTSVSGLVLDHAGAPLPGVMLLIRGTELQAWSDNQGQFRIDDAPVGPIRLLAFGQTTPRPGAWPTLEYDLITVAGVDNVLTMPIHLLRLQDESAVPAVGGDADVSLTLPGVPGFELKVPAHSTSFDGEKRPGKVTVTQVRTDKVPMTPADGTQPSLVLTIQPPSVRFNPPAPITYPNTEGLPPGQMVDMYAFDHDLGRFVTIGPGTVSEDSMVIRSNPGFGVLKGGWEYTGPRAPEGIGEPCRVKIIDGRDQIICLNTPYEFTARVSPPPGTIQWSGGDAPKGITSHNTSGSSSFLTTFTGSPGPRKIQADWTCDSSTQMVSDTIQAYAVQIKFDLGSKLVRLRCKVPPKEYPLNCKAWVLGNPPVDVLISLDNPDKRLGFSSSLLKLPRSGAPVDFQVFGIAPSDALEDAVMRTTLEGFGRSTEVCDQQKLTVYSLGDADIKVTGSGVYALQPNRCLEPVADAAFFEGKATLKPNDLDCTLNETKGLRIGIVQNITSFSLRATYSNPTVTWLRDGSGNQIAPRGSTISIPELITDGVKITSASPPFADSGDPMMLPFYDFPGFSNGPAPCLHSGTIDGACIQRPMGSCGGLTAKSNDTPRFCGVGVSQKIVRKLSGKDAANVIYSFSKITLRADFITWVAYIDNIESSVQACPLREQRWHIDFDSTRPPSTLQKVELDGPETDPTQAPVVSEPIFNDLLCKPENKLSPPLESGSISTVTAP